MNHAREPGLEAELQLGLGAEAGAVARSRAMVIAKACSCGSGQDQSRAGGRVGLPLHLPWGLSHAPRAPSNIPMCPVRGHAPQFGDHWTKAWSTLGN